MKDRSTQFPLDASALVAFARAVADDIAARAVALTSVAAQALIDKELFDLAIEIRCRESAAGTKSHSSIVAALDEHLRERIDSQLHRSRP